MGQAESNESAAVKRQAEGGEVPMYKLLDLSGNFIDRILQSFYVCRIYIVSTYNSSRYMV